MRRFSFALSMALCAPSFLIQCADNNFEFGGNEASADPFEINGLVNILLYKSIFGCSAETYLREIPSFSLDGNPSEFAQANQVFTDPAGDSSGGTGTDFRNIFMGYTTQDGGSLVFFFQLDATPSTSHTLGFSGGGHSVQINGGGTPNLTAGKFPADICKERTDLVRSGASGYEAKVPLSCLTLSTVDRFLLASFAQGQIKIHPNSDFNSISDSISIEGTTCIAWQF